MKTKKIAFLTILMLCLLLTGCGKADTKKTKEGSSSKEQTETIVEEETDNKEDNATKLKFWINSMDWSKEENNNISLYNDKISVPIKLENIDVCSAPYSFWPNGNNCTKADKIQEILTSTTKITAGRETKIATQKQFIDGKWHDFDEEPDNIGDIIIKNYSETDSTLAECYNKGWWYISNIYDIDDLLGLDLTGTGYKRDWDESPLLDGAIEKLGAPTYILGDKTWIKNKDLNEGGMYYDLVYEKEEYTIDIFVFELITSENNNHMTKVSGFKYYSKECWEMEKQNYTSDKYDIIKK